MKRINFYLEQVVAKEDLALLQDNIESMFAALIEDLGIRYAYNGLYADANNPNAMAVRVHPGRCYFGFDGCGQHGVLSTIQLVALNLDKNGAATAVQANGNERWLSVWIIPKTVSDTPVITPAGITIQYRTYDSVDFAVTMGAEAAIGSASRPALESVTNGILICDVRLTYGMTTVPNANIDASRVLSYGQSGQERGALPYLLNTLDNTVSRLNAAEQNIVAIQTELDNFETDTANRLATVNQTLTDLTDHWNAIYASLQTSAGANEIGYQYSSTYGSNTVGAALNTLMQNQLRFYTTGGTAPNYTLTPTPDLTAYALFQRFPVQFHSSSHGATTINISGLGAKRLKQYAAGSGFLVDPVIAAGQLADLVYDGTYIMILTPAPGANLGLQEVVSGDFTLDISHVGRLIVVSGGATVSLANTGTIPSGLCFYLKNGSTTDPATLAMNGNTMESSILTILPSESLVLQSDGGDSYRIISRSSRAPYYGMATSRSYNTVYRASTDIRIIANLIGLYMNGIQALVGITSNPTQLVGRVGDDINNNTKRAVLTFDVPQGWYWKLGPYGDDGWETISINEYPLR